MVKKILIGLVVVVVLVLGAGGTAVAVMSSRGIPKYEPVRVEMSVEVTPERVAHGRDIALLLCAECHKDPQTGKLTGKLMIDAPPEFGPIYSKNITQDKEHGIGSWTDGELAVFIRTGLRPDGQYVPPPMMKLFKASDEDIASIIAFLHSDDPLVEAVAVDPPGVSEPSLLTIFLCNVAFKPLPYPSGPILRPTEEVALGRYLADELLECYSCHSADFKTLNQPNPPESEGYYGGGNALIRLDGGKIFSRNITPDEKTGIGSWSEEEFIKALRTGFRPDGTLIRYPMSPMRELTDEELSAIYAYLQTVPAIVNEVSDPIPPIEKPGGEDAGRVAYYKYGCNACHGDNGVGIGDIRRARVDFPDDEALEAWIRDAPSIRPETRMPTWNGVIAEEDYPHLIQYVRKLSNET